MGSLTLAAWLLTLGTAVQEIDPETRLYGRVTTVGGDVFEGFLRWDKNEGSWVDLLDGSKEIPWENYRDAERLDDEYARRRERERSIHVFGLRISWDEDDRDDRSIVQSGIRFGHLSALEVLDDHRALLLLKGGGEVEFSHGSTDIGNGLRGLLVDDPARGEVELRWRDLDRIDFMAAPPGVGAPIAERLYGTLHTRSGLEFTGWVAWDVDEIMGSDILDGEERGRSRKIPFDRIAAIERAGRSGAHVVLHTGEQITLRNSNDVDSGNRGVSISDPALGQVRVDWDEFDRLRLHEPVRGGGTYDSFSGGTPLYGEVVTRGGRALRGFVRWDNDEEQSWEILDGNHAGVQFDIEFSQVRSIRKRGSWGAEVTLLDGRVFDLEGSNDVDEDNKGIFVTSERGDTELVRWWDFVEVTFEGR